MEFSQMGGETEKVIIEQKSGYEDWCSSCQISMDTIPDQQASHHLHHPIVHEQAQAHSQHPEIELLRWFAFSRLLS